MATIKRVAEYHAWRDEDIVDTALEIVSQRFARGKKITSTECAKKFFALKLCHYEREVFACLFLDSRHQVLAYEELFFGTINGASVHPREIVKRALALNSSAVLLTHNHPSGASEMSQADRDITQRIKDALSLVDVKVLDHIVVAGGETESFSERGLL